MYAEHLVEFIEDRARPRLVEALPWELRALEPVRYDAVVLVHPGWDIRGPQRDDLRKLAAAGDLVDELLILNGRETALGNLGLLRRIAWTMSTGRR